MQARLHIPATIVLAGLIASLYLLWLASADTEAGVSCFGRTPTIMGTNGADELTGTDGADVIYARGGNDLVQAREGRDRVCGGGGDDELHGGDGTDRTRGDAGDDFLDGRRGLADTLLGGRGEDTAIGGSVIKGGPNDDDLDSYAYLREVGVDRVLGGAGNDLIKGDSRGSFGERLEGGPGADEIHGRGDDDDLRGDDGNDSLFGDAGNDQLRGGPGTDSCDQGPGSGPVLTCES